MLILSRRPHESIRISGQIRITLLGFKGGQARIGIEAPANVAVDREEIYFKKREEEESRGGRASGNR